MALTVTRIDGPLGAEVAGVDLAQPLPAAAQEQIEGAFHEHLVLLFRGQHLTQDQLVAFGRLFGELHRTEGFTYGAKPVGTLPEIELISNQPEDAVPAGARASAEATWHTDMSMLETPASASLLYAIEVPSGQGQTRFANHYLAWETLQDDLRAAVRGRRSIHDAAYTAMDEIRAGYQGYDDPSKAPGARHPVVRTHPVTGREALYLGRKGYGYIEGYAQAESTRLLARLWEHMTRPELVWSHDWRDGDLVVWDNRCCSHSRAGFDPSLRRRLMRVTAIGERPYHEGGQA